MKTLSIASSINKNAFSSDVAWLVAIDVDIIDPSTLQKVTTIYLVNNNEDISINGTSYIAVPFSINIRSEQGEIPEVSLTIQDQSQIVQSYMQKFNGGTGFKVRMHAVNSERLEHPPESTEYFEVTSASSTDYVATWQLGAENMLRQKCPRRKQHRDFCTWVYKDPDTCAYTGNMPTCDHSLSGVNGCKAHSNEANFGGFPSIQVRRI